MAQKANLSFKDKLPYISVIDEASDFKFGLQVGFANAHHKITPRGKSGRGLGLMELSKIWGSPLIFLQQLKLATSNFAYSCGLPSAIIKSHPQEKVFVDLG